MVTPEWEQRTGAKVEFTREAFGPLPLKLTPAFESGGRAGTSPTCGAPGSTSTRSTSPLRRAGADGRRDRHAPGGHRSRQGSSGKFYGLPSNIYTYILYCNKKIFADAGVTIPKTYAEFTWPPSSSRPATSSATSTAGRRSICSQVVRLVPPQRRRPVRAERRGALQRPGGDQGHAGHDRPAAEHAEGGHRVALGHL